MTLAVRRAIRLHVEHTAVALTAMFATSGGLSSVTTAAHPLIRNADRVDRRHLALCPSCADSLPPDSTLPVRVPRLRVRPRAMATGTRTVHAGAQLLDSLRQTWVYVPPQCVGTHRCPLVVVFGGAAISATEMVHPGRPLADRSPFADHYGMILLAPEATAAPGIWDVLTDGTTWGNQTPVGMHVTQFRDADVRNIDAALTQVLRRFAIDPEQIAVEGFSNGGSYALFLGRNNPQVFSRIAAVSPTFPIVVDDPTHATTQLFLSGGIAEGPFIMRMWLRIATLLRHEGHQVEMVPGLRGHVDDRLDKDYEWEWLAQSWASPKPQDTSRIAPAVNADPILTVEILAKMTTFWTRFMQEPDSVLTAGRQVHEVPLTLAIGEPQVSVVAVQMTALATQYPSVAADLQGAGLTAEEEDRYRAAILRVGLAHMVDRAAGHIAATSVLGQNLVFRQAHDQAFKTLGATGMWLTP